MGSALPGLGLPSKADIYAAALEGLVQVNGLILDKHPNIPPIYGAGVRFKPIPHDTWRRADVIAGEGWGDCEGLSAWRCAELRRTGEDPGARVGCYHTGPRKYHAVVIRSDDTIEDPSVILGMKPRANMPPDRYAMNYINGMWPSSPGFPSVSASLDVVGWADDDSPESSITTKYEKLPSGETQAVIDFPLADGTKLVAKTSAALDQATAAAKSANLLADTASVIAKNPALLAKMNPYAAAAIMMYSSPQVRASLKALGAQAVPLAHKAESAAKASVNFFRSLF